MAIFCIKEIKTPQNRLKKKKKRSNADFHFMCVALIISAWVVFYVLNDGNPTEEQGRIFALILVILFMGFLFGLNWYKKKYKDYMNNKKNKDWC